MICLGYSNQWKIGTISNYCRKHAIKKVFILSPEKFKFEYPCETIPYQNIIEYTFFYRLLQEIDASTLLVINECLRTQNRYDLTYNCIRNFLNQTGHQIIFQYLPLINTMDDLYILVDWDTKSRWKRVRDEPLIKEADIIVNQRAVGFNRVDIEVSQATKAKYDREKEKLIDGIGLKDPHTIPRNLYLLSGKEKVACINPDKWYIGRNNRFKFSNIQTFKEVAYQHQPYTIFETCHNFIDMADFITLSGQDNLDFMIADLKVDQWYFERYRQWAQRLSDAYSKIQQQQNRTGCSQGADIVYL